MDPHCRNDIKEAPKRACGAYASFWLAFERDRPVLAWVSVVVFGALVSVGLGLGLGDWVRAVVVIVAACAGVLVRGRRDGLRGCARTPASSVRVRVSGRVKVAGQAVVVGSYGSA